MLADKKHVASCDVPRAQGKNIEKYLAVQIYLNYYSSCCNNAATRERDILMYNTLSADDKEHLSDVVITGGDHRDFNEKMMLRVYASSKELVEEYFMDAVQDQLFENGGIESIRSTCVIFSSAALVNDCGIEYAHLGLSGIANSASAAGGLILSGWLRYCAHQVSLDYDEVMEIVEAPPAPCLNDAADAAMRSES
jgi:hypothetical protein